MIDLCRRAVHVLLVSLACAWGLPGHAADEIHVLFMVSTGLERSAQVQMLQQFERENPGSKIVQHFVAQEEYKRDFEKNIARKPIDVAFWFAGERMRQLSGKGLLRPFDADLTADLSDQFTHASMHSTQVGKQTFGMPLSYYAWGFFYSKSLFRELGLEVPQTWEDLLSVSEAIRRKGAFPFAVGAKAGWPVAAWFDYLNLRMHGLEFHQKLLRGEVALSDPRVKDVMLQWRHVLEKGYFLPEAMPLDWDGVFPYLYRRQVGMVLMGGFAAARFPTGSALGRQVTDDVGFFQFPKMNPKVPTYEDAPLDVLVLPSSGKNPSGANRLLRFMSRAPVMNPYNQAVRQLSPRKDAPKPDDPFLSAGKSVLDTAEGIAFFFDRDARDALVAPAFAAFRQFLTPPHDVDAAIARLQGTGKP